MNERMKAIQASKQMERTRLADMQFADKIPILEKLRDRALAIAGSSLYMERGSRSGKAWFFREKNPRE